MSDTDLHCLEKSARAGLRAIYQKAPTKTHSSQLCLFEDFVATVAAIFEGSRLREAFLPSRRNQHANNCAPRTSLP